MNLDDKYIYVFIRQDLSVAEQLVHVGHATLHLGQTLSDQQGIPNLVIIGVPHPQALAKVLRKLDENQIRNHVWIDPDCAAGPLAVATEPLTVERKEVLSNYRLWKQ